MKIKISNELNRHANIYFIFGCVLNLVLSILPRLIFLKNIPSPWRGTQTLITSFWFQKSGISLFNYQTPLFGPPWKVPFEFPLYQAICTIFSKIIGKSLTSSSHVVSLAIFYLSALFLILLSLEFLQSKTLTLIIFVVYLWLPYNIRYSTEILIDYLSVALALSYIYWIKKWFDSPRNYLILVFAIISGCLGAVVKISTMPIIIVPAILIALNGILSWGIRLEDFSSWKKIIDQVRKHRLSLLLLMGIVILPLLSIILWTRFTDGIKHANIYTDWLTSTNLSGWYFGSLPMKLSLTNWLNWLTKIHTYFFNGAILIFPILGILLLYKMPVKSRFFFGSALIGSFLVIFIFFNLYLHEYYYISISAYMSVLIGIGIYCLYKYILPHKVWWGVLSGVLFFFVFLGGVEQYQGIRKTVNAEGLGEYSSFVPMANKVTAITPEGGYIISLQSDWYPDFLFFAQRKGLVISPRNEAQFTCASIANINYTTLVSVNMPANSPAELAILKCFKSAHLIEPGLYRIAP